MRKPCRNRKPTLNPTLNRPRYMAYEARRRAVTPRPQWGCGGWLTPPQKKKSDEPLPRSPVEASFWEPKSQPGRMACGQFLSESDSANPKSINSTFLEKNMEDAVDVSWFGLSPPLWKMMDFVSWDDEIPWNSQYIYIYMWKNKSHVPSHQPVVMFFPLWMEWIFPWSPCEAADASGASTCCFEAVSFRVNGRFYKFKPS